MQKLLLLVDKLSTFVARRLLADRELTLLHHLECTHVCARPPDAWAFDVMIMITERCFMMAGAYTLAKNSHVRGDVLYGFFRRGCRPSRPHVVHPVLISGHRRVRLGRLHLCGRVLGDQRAFRQLLSLLAGCLRACRIIRCMISMIEMQGSLSAHRRLTER